MVELLVWPTVIASGEASLVYAGELRGHRRYSTLGIWGVRIGWLAQTVLLAAKLSRLERETGDLAGLARARPAAGDRVDV